VHDSVRAQSRAGEDDYGYGWWVSPDDYYAMGRGGQYIKVMSSLNAVVVTTGGGFDYDQVVSFLKAALIDPGQPLRSNPAGVAKLEETLAKIGQQPPPQSVGPLPETAGMVSGKVYVFKPNLAEVETLSLEFDASSQAILHIILQGSDKTHDWPIGLDGKYRLSSEGLALRGYWADPQTFVFEIFDIGQSTYQLHFEDDRVRIDSPELGIKFEGQRENP
jgi:hypothetical protein